MGKMLVAELGDERDCDTFSRWLAHYVAEQIVIAEKAKGKSKALAEKECFDSILKLWAHRSHYPEKNRPLESFDKIFSTLKVLSSEDSYRYLMDSRSEKTAEDDLASWLKVAEATDYAASALIKFFLNRAAEVAFEREGKWVPLALSVKDQTKSDTASIRFLLNGETEEEHNAKLKRERLQGLKVKLEKFIDLSRGASSEIDKILEE